ncbi:MAG: agmatinase [Desulfobacterales bacterium]|nr:agmatinase [Desulfobacterales bacterium]MDP6681678.1 agmatinase [Desulfobacterales bacterium]MDP6807413.1 agmatinase [Desulfobacterales bacterium]
MDSQTPRNLGPERSMTAPRYMEIPTFMRSSLITDLDAFDIAMVGIPYDGAVTNRPGARHGPREIRNASTMMRSIHPVTRINPYRLCRVGDAGDVPFTRAYEVEETLNDITRFFTQLYEADVVPLAAGGDHSVTLAILRAMIVDGPIGMVHIDAHTDTWDEFMGCKFMHGTPFRRAVEKNLIDPGRTVQIGIRGAQNKTEGWDYSLDSGMRVIFMDEFTKIGVAAVIDEIHRVIGDGRAYISFDIDVLDPAFAPGTGTPEVGGLTTIEALTLLRGLNPLNLIGADVVEVSPPYDPSGNTALVGATIMYELLCLLAEAVSRG